MENTISWEVESRFEKISVNEQEVWLIGYDVKGSEYTAKAIEVCGELENISEVEKYSIIWTGKAESTIDVELFIGKAVEVKGSRLNSNSYLLLPNGSIVKEGERVYKN